MASLPLGLDQILLLATEEHMCEQLAQATASTANEKNTAQFDKSQI